MDNETQKPNPAGMTGNVKTWKDIEPDNLARAVGYKKSKVWESRLFKMCHRRNLYPNDGAVLNGIYFDVEDEDGPYKQWFHNSPKTDEDERVARTYAKLKAANSRYAYRHMNPHTCMVEDVQ